MLHARVEALTGSALHHHESGVMVATAGFDAQPQCDSQFFDAETGRFGAAHLAAPPLRGVPLPQPRRRAGAPALLRRPGRPPHGPHPGRARVRGGQLLVRGPGGVWAALPAHLLVHSGREARRAHAAAAGPPPQAPGGSGDGPAGARWRCEREREREGGQSAGAGACSGARPDPRPTSPAPPRAALRRRPLSPGTPVRPARRRSSRPGAASPGPKTPRRPPPRPSGAARRGGTRPPRATPPSWCRRPRPSPK